MMASRGMGDINPSKMPSGKRKVRRDDTDFTEYAEGGKVTAKYMKLDRKSTRLNSSHIPLSRMPSSA